MNEIVSSLAFVVAQKKWLREIPNMTTTLPETNITSRNFHGWKIKNAWIFGGDSTYVQRVVAPWVSGRNSAQDPTNNLVASAPGAAPAPGVEDIITSSNRTWGVSIHRDVQILGRYQLALSLVHIDFRKCFNHHQTEFLSHFFQGMLMQVCHPHPAEKTGSQGTHLRNGFQPT